MDIYANFQPFFCNFFLRLKKDTGMELDSAQYEDFLTCWLTYKTTDKEELYHLCETIFLTRSEFRPAFIRIFDEHFALFENISVDDTIKPEEIIDGPKRPPNATKKGETIDTKGSNIQETPGLIEPTEPVEGTIPNPQLDLQSIDTADWPEINLTIKESGNGKGFNEDAEKKNYKPSKFIFLPEKAIPFDVVLPKNLPTR
jgi:uncharacterized protein with von Willebrand factor type A (vWA) domain